MGRKCILLESYNLLKYKIIFNSQGKINRSKIFDLREAQNYVRNIGTKSTVIFKSVETDEKTTSYAGYDYEDVQGEVYYFKQLRLERIPEGHIILKFNVFFVKNMKKIDMKVNYEVNYMTKNLPIEIESPPTIVVEQMKVGTLTPEEIDEYLKGNFRDEGYKEKMEKITSKHMVKILTTNKKLDENVFDENESYIVTVTAKDNIPIKFFMTQGWSEAINSKLFYKIFNYYMNFIKYPPSPFTSGEGGAPKERSYDSYLLFFDDDKDYTGKYTYFKRLCYK